MRIRIEYQSRAGAWCRVYLAPDEDVYGRLQLLRKRGVKVADVWIVDDWDAKLNCIGGIEEAEGADDQRIKYQVWAR